MRGARALAPRHSPCSWLAVQLIAASPRCVGAMSLGSLMQTHRRSLVRRAPVACAKEGAGTQPLLDYVPHGVLVAYKPQNWTSFDVCACIRGSLERHLKGHGHKFGRRSRLKVGHGGTLDPLAEGMLVVGIGTGCKGLQDYIGGQKGYSARARLGLETDSQDSEGVEIESREWRHVTLEQLQSASKAFVGDIMQRPPIYSALKKDGKRMYELARKGEVRESDMEPRAVTVHMLQVTDLDTATGEFTLDVKCSGGTYVRTLIVDLARAVNSAACMTGLERFQVGRLSIRAPPPLGCQSVQPVHDADFKNAPRLYEALDSTSEALALAFAE